MSSFTRPTLAELVDRVQSDFVSRLEMVTAILRRSVVYVLARVIAGAVHMLHGHLDWVSRQIFADQSEREYLVRDAAVRGVAPTAATFATGTVTVTGTNTTVIPIDTVLLRSDGEEYTVDAEVIVATLTAWVNTTGYTVGQLRRNSGNIYICITAGTSAGSGGPTTTAADITDGTVHWRYIAAGSAAISAAVTASTAGADPTLTIADLLTFESPISGADSTAPVATSEDGSDEEGTEAFRARYLAFLRLPPEGGADHDYEAWALEVAGVTRAWVYPLEDGAGTVTVRFVRDDDVSIFPSGGEVSDVQDHLDEEAPITAEVTAEAPVDAPVAFTLEITPDNSDTRDAVEAELTDLFRREAAPGDGAGFGTILLSDIETAVRQAAGITDRIVTVPAADVVPALGELSTVGVITWV